MMLWLSGAEDVVSPPADYDYYDPGRQLQMIEDFEQTKARMRRKSNVLLMVMVNDPGSDHASKHEEEEDKRRGTSYSQLTTPTNKYLEQP